MLLGDGIWKGDGYASRLGPRMNCSPMALWSSARKGRGDFRHLCRDRVSWAGPGTGAGKLIFFCRLNCRERQRREPQKKRLL